jgi:hypothetical protein
MAHPGPLHILVRLFTASSVEIASVGGKQQVIQNNSHTAPYLRCTGLVRYRLDGAM